MASLVRMLNRGCLLRKSLPLVTRRSTMTTKRNAYDEMKEYWVKNEKLARPMSPVLSIYGYHLTMVMSIGNRVTAVILQKMLVGGSCIMLIAPVDFKSIVKKIRDWKPNPALVYSAKAFVAVPFVYHTLCSIRHLVWDTGVGYHGNTVVRGGYTILMATALFSSILVFGIKPSAECRCS